MSPAILAATLLVSAPCDEAHPVERNDVASCSGVMLPLSEATHALRCLTIGLPSCEQDNAHCEATRATERGFCKERVGVLESQVTALEDSLASMAKCPECERAWWDSPGIGFGAGVVTTVAVVVALVFGTN